MAGRNWRNRRREMKQVLLLAAFLSSSAALADDPPGFVWERDYDYPGVFNDVTASSAGVITCTGPSGAGGKVIWSFDQGNGNLLWSTGIPGLYRQTGNRLVELPSGGLAVAGTCKITAQSTYDLFICLFDATGSLSWSEVIQNPATQDYGMDIAALPDGGFVVCGHTQVPGLGTQALLCRFSSEGDTLWTRTWGPSANPDYGVAVEFAMNGITLLVEGTHEGSSWGPVLLRYSMDGV
jgi:hypothetical protein